MIILGAIQGITEWLPISSEAMVALSARFFFGFEYKEALNLAIWLHLGTALAAIAYFWKEILEVLKSAFDKTADRALLWFLVVATVVTALIAGPILVILLTSAPEIPDWIFTMVIGVFLVGIAYTQKNRPDTDDKKLNINEGIIAGIAQGLAAFPGISRSGITTAALLARQFSLKQAFFLSFLMSIPVTIGVQVVMPLIDESHAFAVDGPMIVGGLVAALIGFITIKELIAFAQRINFFKATLTLGIIIIALGLALLL